MRDVLTELTRWWREGHPVGGHGGRDLAKRPATGRRDHVGRPGRYGRR